MCCVAFYHISCSSVICKYKASHIVLCIIAFWTSLIWSWPSNSAEIVFSFWLHTTRCVDILELLELDDLMTFHHRTLLLYCSLCALGNTRVCHALCSHVDQSQLLHAIQNPHLPGPLRSAFYQLLIQVIACLSSCFFKVTLINTRMWKHWSLRTKKMYILFFLGSPQQPCHCISHDEPRIYCAYDWSDQRNHPVSQPF